MALNPNEMTYYTNKGAVYFSMGDYETCIAECRKAVAKAEEGYYDYVKLSKAYARIGAALG